MSISKKSGINGKAGKTAENEFEMKNREIIRQAEKDTLEAVSFCDKANASIRFLADACRMSRSCSECLLSLAGKDGKDSCPLTDSIPAFWPKLYGIEEERTW